MNAHSPPLPARDAAAHDLFGVARRYCDLIDAAGGDAPDWLLEVASLLPRLHAAMATAHQHPISQPVQVPLADLDRRFDLFSRLRGLLDGRDSYFLEFDRFQEGLEAMTGSLADDLTDIYCELATGLLAYEADPGLALDAWCVGYDSHWGQHLVDAERHLASLAASNRLVAEVKGHRG